MPVEKIERAIMQKELETNQLVEEPQHVTPQVPPPPELPAAPPRTALIIVGLVVVVGPQPPGPPGSMLGASDLVGLRIASTLPPSFRAQVTEVRIEPGGWVQLEMTTPIVVDIGSASQLDDSGTAQSGEAGCQAGSKPEGERRRA